MQLGTWLRGPGANSQLGSEAGVQKGKQGAGGACGGGGGNGGRAALEASYGVGTFSIGRWAGRAAAGVVRGRGWQPHGGLAGKQPLYLGVKQCQQLQLKQPPPLGPALLCPTDAPKSWWSRPLHAPQWPPVQSVLQRCGQQVLRDTGGSLQVGSLGGRG